MCLPTRDRRGFNLNSINMKALFKTILTLLAALTIATGYTQKPGNTHTILIGANGRNLSQTELTASAAILTQRLKSFGDETFILTALPEKSQIRVELNGSSNPALIEKLLIKRGVLGFYVVCSRDEFVKNPQVNNELSAVLKTPGHQSLPIGCTDVAGMAQASAYLETPGLGQHLLYAWNDFSNTEEVCLYALKLGEKDGPLACNADIESFTAGNDAQGKPDSFGFSFRPEAVQLWADITANNIGSAIAMVLDGSVIYTPVITDAITGGKCQVTGRFSSDEIRYIVSIVNSGVLPAEFSVIK